MSFVVEIQGTKELESNLLTIANRLKMGKEEVLDMWAREVQSKFISNAPRNTGELQSSIDVKDSSENTRTVGPTGEAEGYASAVETGNAAHWPAWTYALRRKSISERFGTDDKVSFLIARKISKQAGRATGFATKTYIYAKSIFEEMIKNLVAQAIKT